MDVPDNRSEKKKLMILPDCNSDREGGTAGKTFRSRERKNLVRTDPNQSQHWRSRYTRTYRKSGMEEAICNSPDCRWKEERDRRRRELPSCMLQSTKGSLECCGTSEPAGGRRRTVAARVFSGCCRVSRRRKNEGDGISFLNWVMHRVWRMNPQPLQVSYFDTIYP